MPFEQCFSRLPAVNALDNAKAWRPSYREWLSAQFEEGVDHTTVARLLEDNNIGEAEAAAGESDAAWMLRRAADDDDFQLGDALDFIGAKKADAPHAHALSETDWKSSPWYRKEIPFRPDMTPTRARLMAENFDRRRFRERLLARGDEIYNGPGDMALGFGATLLGSIADPVSFIPFGGGVAARGAGTLGRALWAGARSGVVNGAASAALVDGLILPDLASRGEDVAFSELVLDTLAGGVLGLVFGAAGGLFAHRAARRRGTADATPARLAEAAPAPEPTPFEVSPDAARNAEADLLRQGWAAGDRRAVADAAALGMEDLADGRPVDVAAALRESKALERAYDAVLRDPLGGSPDDVLVTLEVEDIERVFVYRGPAVMRDGQIVVQGRTVQRETGSRRGYGLVKIVFAHGEGGNKRPDMPPVTREDVIALPHFVREYESDFDGSKREWRIPREDGNALYIATSRLEDKEASMLVSMYVGALQPDQAFSVKKPRVASSVSRVFRNEDTGRGITISHPAGEQGASHMTDSSLPGTSSPVNPHVPDFSTAPEPPAPPRMTPDEARRAETEALAGQDEALRQRVTERKGRR